MVRQKQDGAAPRPSRKRRKEPEAPPPPDPNRIERVQRVTRPGLYLMSAADYHADPCPEPSLSASIAHELITRSPRHAWELHPKLNPAWRPDDPTDAMEEGTALHWLLTGAGAKPYLVNADDWRSFTARTHRSEARAQGRPPILEWRWRQLLRVAAAARIQLRRQEDAPPGIENGLAEAVLIWREGPIWCRCMVDWLPTQIPYPPMVDFKFTQRAGTPEDYRRQVADLSYDMRQAFYRRGFEAVFGRSAGPYVFAVVETAPPYGVATYTVGDAFEELGLSKLQMAFRLWRHCMQTDSWPGYTRRMLRLDAPVYASLDWEQRVFRAEQQIAGTGNVMRGPRGPVRLHDKGDEA